MTTKLFLVFLVSMLCGFGCQKAKSIDSSLVSILPLQPGASASPAMVDPNVTNSLDFIDISIPSVTVNASGTRPVWIGLQGTDGTICYLSTAGHVAMQAQFRFMRDSTALSGNEILAQTPIHIPCGSVWHIDQPSSGLHTYKAQMNARVGWTQVQNVKLVAVEL